MNVDLYFPACAEPAARKAIKIAMPQKLITGNGWDAFPMVNDGRQSEGWQAIDNQREK